MLTYTIQQAIDAKANDILDFLERNSQSIHSNRQAAGQSNKIESQLCIAVARKGHRISIYAKPCASGGHRAEIIRFEVKEYPINKSLIDVFYDSSNPQFLLLFYRIWTRLAIAFGAPFAGEALRKLHELE